MPVLSPPAPAGADTTASDVTWPVPRAYRPVPGTGDRTFIVLMRLGAVGVVVVIALVGLFLAVRAVQAISVAKFSFLTTQAWEPDIHHFGILGVDEHRPGLPAGGPTIFPSTFKTLVISPKGFQNLNSRACTNRFSSTALDR